MTQKTKATRRILEAVHEIATDLHGAGLIDPRRANGGRVGEVADVT
ncbi:MAG: hypothetical protein LM522_07580 [Candidatus Contendobacter sp.]|nr:hypothetical protein [Candidatus Contendobacter sp.]